MIKEMIWAVIIKPNYMAELHYGFKNTKKDPKIVYFELNKELPLQHGDNRAIINVQLSKVGIIGSRFDIRHFENGNQMMYGSMRYESQFVNERGFSLVEVMVVAGIVAVIMAVCLPAILDATANIKANIQTAKTMQVEQQQTEQDMLNSILEGGI